MPKIIILPLFHRDKKHHLVTFFVQKRKRKIKALNVRAAFYGSLTKFKDVFQVYPIHANILNNSHLEKHINRSNNKVYVQNLAHIIRKATIF